MRVLCLIRASKFESLRTKTTFLKISQKFPDFIAMATIQFRYINMDNQLCTCNKGWTGYKVELDVRPLICCINIEFRKSILEKKSIKLFWLPKHSHLLNARYSVFGRYPVYMIRWISDKINIRMILVVSASLTTAFVNTFNDWFGEYSIHISNQTVLRLNINLFLSYSAFFP